MGTIVIEVTVWEADKIEALVAKIEADARVMKVEVLA